MGEDIDETISWSKRSVFRLVEAGIVGGKVEAGIVGGN